MKDIGFAIGWILVFALFLFLIPWAFIHGVNGLFGTNIEHTIGNFGWFWLLYIISSGSVKTRS